MSKLSISFTLGKASAGEVNIEHNNREFISSNVDVSRVVDNITYVRQDIHEAYDELFSDSLREYNAKQTRKDRQIHDYFQHVLDDKRKETHYEVLVQFGDSNTAGVGTENGKLATRMLDEYMRNFRTRNPNLHIVSSVAHLDESTPHLHIDFIPFYTKGNVKGLSKGVSMRAALEEQGFTSQNKKLNSMVAWENSEMQVLENILNKHGLARDIKGATHMHKSVPEYKASLDWRKFPKRKKNLSTLEVYHEDLKSTRVENSLLKVENEKLISKRNSPWKSFYYSDTDKQSFVQVKLGELNIPFRESENSFEAQACYIEDIRKLEKQYVSNPTSHREKLRNRLDKIVMQISDYDKIFEGLEFYGYEVKHGKYTAVKAKDGSQFIRLKSLGEMYNEQALRNRVQNRLTYESQVRDKLNSIQDKQSLEYRVHYTVLQYVVTFKGGRLPTKKVNKKQPFTFINDVELDRLASLNKKINEGVTLTSLRQDLRLLENSIAQKEERISSLKEDLQFNEALYEKAVNWYSGRARNQADLAILEKHKLTMNDYGRLKNDIEVRQSSIADLEEILSADRAKLADTLDTLNSFERIMSMTYVDALVQAEHERRQAARIGNGLKSADASMDDNFRVGAIAERVVEAIERRAEKSEEVEQEYTPKLRK